MGKTELTADIRKTLGKYGHINKNGIKSAKRVLRLKNCKQVCQIKLSMDSVKPRQQAIKLLKSCASEDKLSDFNPSYYPYLKRFQTAINRFASKYCEICHQLLYESQVLAYCLIPGKIPTYLPNQLISKSFLYVCLKCNNHLIRQKFYPPATSYWNNMDPGKIPEEIMLLSEFESRLIARYIPFLKIVDFNGIVGEFDCDAAALLFDQNTIKTDDKPLNKLPRSPESADLVIVATNIEEVGIFGEFVVSKHHINNALNWLISNNPFYKDVTKDSMQMDIKDTLWHPSLVTLHQGHPNWIQPFQFHAINSDARLLQASWNQSEKTVFKIKNAGTQCCAMALSAIIRAHITPPSQWTPSICNEWLFMGDELYEVVRVLSTVSGEEIPSSGFLYVKNFNVIKDYFVAFNSLFSIKFDKDPAIFGNLNDCCLKVGQPLVLGLKNLFEHHSCGILIALQKCYAVMKFKEKFYFADAHACGEQGAPAADDTGTACIIECDSLYELHRVVRRANKSSNNIYTLDYIDVVSIHGNEVNCYNLLPTRLTAHMQHEENVSVVPVTPSLMHLCDYTQNQTICDNDDVNIRQNLKEEELEWYFLYPYGKNGLFEKRPVPITLPDYFQTRILGVDLRFQRSDYLFYAFLKCEYHCIKSNAEIYRLKSQQNFNSNIYIKNLHGSSAYWKTALNDLIGQIRCFGPPHFFLTFSCIDLTWPDMRKALLLADKDADRNPISLTTTETQILIEKYPVTVCRHVMNRIEALMDFIKNDHLVLGSQVLDYWWRIDFQNQSAPHLQLLVWVSNPTNFNCRKDIHRLDRVISCRIPEDPELKELVVKLQSHMHTPTCFKQTTSFCHFPHSSCKGSRIISQSSKEFFQNGGNFFVLKRKANEGLINNYNLRLLKLWQGSMDIQPCGSIKAFAFYTTKHIFKNIPTGLDKALLDTFKKIQLKETEISPKFLACEEIYHKHKVSTFECVFRLCNFKLHESSRQCVFLNTQRLKLENQVLKFGNGDGSEELGSNIIKLYRKRPQQHYVYDFKSMCLLEFSMLFDPNFNQNAADSNKDFSSEQFLVLEDGTRMLIRSSPAVVTVPYTRLSSDFENYYYNLLLQYYPFRSELELFYGFKTIRESFEAKNETFSKMSPLLKEHLSRDEELHLSFNYAHECV